MLPVVKSNKIRYLKVGMRTVGKILFPTFNHLNLLTINGGEKPTPKGGDKLSPAVIPTIGIMGGDQLRN